MVDPLAPPAPLHRSARVRHPRARHLTGRMLRSLFAKMGRAGIFGIDRLLRRWYGVYEFSNSDDDLLRISIRAAKAPLTLSDGTRVMPGDPIIDLHIWNERVPFLGALRPSLLWASRARRRIERSLLALARHLEQCDDLDRCVALRAVAIFVSSRTAGKVARIAARYGMTPPLEARRATLGHGLLAFGLSWACNPDSLVGKRLKPTRYEFWMSSGAFRQRYSHAEAAGDDSLPRHEAVGVPPVDITAAC